MPLAFCVVRGAPVEGISTRLVTEADAEATRRIYNREVSGSTVTFDLVPRSLDEQVEWIRQHAGAHPAVVAILRQGEGEEVVGFGSLSAYRSRPAYSTTVEDSVYVDPDHQGQGIGKVVLGELVSLAVAHGFHTIMARIVGGHETSIRLHESCGFVPVGLEREVGRKFGKWLDVALMQRML